MFAADNVQRKKRAVNAARLFFMQCLIRCAEERQNFAFAVGNLSDDSSAGVRAKNFGGRRERVNQRVNFAFIESECFHDHQQDHAGNFFVARADKLHDKNLSVSVDEETNFAVGQRVAVETEERPDNRHAGELFRVVKLRAILQLCEGDELALFAQSLVDNAVAHAIDKFFRGKVRHAHKF